LAPQNATRLTHVCAQICSAGQVNFGMVGWGSETKREPRALHRAKRVFRFSKHGNSLTRRKAKENTSQPLQRIDFAPVFRQNNHCA